MVFGAARPVVKWSIIKIPTSQYAVTPLNVKMPSFGSTVHFESITFERILC